MDILAIVLLCLAVMGHLLLGLRLYNWCYGYFISELGSDIVRNGLSLLIVACPIVYVIFFGVDGLASYAHWPVFAYVVFCWIVVGVAFPIFQIRYWLRRPPPAQLSIQSRVVNIAEQLGTRPFGPHKHLRLAKLPGNELFQLELVEKTLHHPRWPSVWDGLTILHLSDLHFCRCPERPYFRRVVELCNEWKPDLIALTGDIVDGPTEHRWVIPLLGRLRCNLKAFAILGNHDYRFDVERTRRRLRRIGMTVLVNDWQTLDVRGEPLLVIGHEGPWLSPPPNLSGCPRGPFRLCLSHTPDNINWARDNHIDLMLSGHVHGGQIQIPGIGSVFVPSVYGRRFDSGTFQEGQTLLHVSRGVAGEHPVRYNCRPEATLLTLTSGMTVSRSESDAKR